MRHTFISEAIAAGIDTFEVARMAGTSVLQIEKTYGHLLPDAIERSRGALDGEVPICSHNDQRRRPRCLMPGAFPANDSFGQLSGNDD